MQIIPTILEKDFLKAEIKIDQINELTRWIQIDVIDGKFNPEKSFELELIKSLRIDSEKKLWEIHLMVNEPKNWIEKCDFIGASRIIGQVEMMEDRNDFVEKVRDKGIESGLAFDIETEIENIPEETELVLLMARKSGFEARDLDERIFKRIEKLKKIREENNLMFKIGIDGGVREENLEKIKSAGADIAYCGGAIFNGMVKSNLEKLKKIAE